MKLTITVSSGGGTPKVLEFTKGEISIGRAEGNDVVLPSGAVSRSHASLQVHDDGITALDLDSVSGTYVNGERLTGPRVLNDADILHIGIFSLEVRFGQASLLDAPQHPGLTDNILAVEVTGPDGTQLLRISGTLATIGREMISDVVLDHESVPEEFGSFFVQGSAVAVVVEGAVRWLGARDTVEVGVFTLRARYGPRLIVGSSAPAPVHVDGLDLVRFAAANHCNAGVVPEDRLVPTPFRTWQQGPYACSEWSTGRADPYRRKNFLMVLAGGCAAAVTAPALASLELLPQDAWCTMFPRTIPPEEGWEDNITREPAPGPTMKDPTDDHVLVSIDRMGPVVLVNHMWSDCMGRGGDVRAWVDNQWHFTGLPLIAAALAKGAPSLEEMVRWVRVLGGERVSPVDTKGALEELIGRGLAPHVSARWHAPRMEGGAMQCVCHQKEQGKLVQLSHAANTGLRQVVLGDAPTPPMDMGCE